MIRKYSHLFLLLLVVLVTIVMVGDHRNLREQQRQAALEVERLASRQAELLQKSLHVNQEQIKCMALNIYHEASNEPFMGQVAVARVVINRVKHGFASNPCKVIYQTHFVRPDPESDQRVRTCQFSWVCEGKTNPPASHPKYKQAEEIARKVILEDGWREDVPGSILFFHNKTVDPNWAYRRILTIGNHVFYGRPAKKPKQDDQNS